MKKDRSVDWCQQKILQVLEQNREIRTYLALSGLVLEKGVRSVQESRNLNITITNLVVTGEIRRTTNKEGFIVYQRIDKSLTKGGSQ